MQLSDGARISGERTRSRAGDDALVIADFPTLATWFPAGCKVPILAFLSPAEAGRHGNL
jgi:hypothetical protein